MCDSIAFIEYNGEEGKLMDGFNLLWNLADSPDIPVDDVFIDDTFDMCYWLQKGRSFNRTCKQKS